MLNYTRKKKSKLNTYKAVRENINLNRSENGAINLTKNLLSEENLVFQITEINLTSHLPNQKVNKNGKLIVKWWEN